LPGNTIPGPAENTNTGPDIPDRNANLLDSLDVWIYWHNLLKLHMSFSLNEGEMPHRAFWRKFPVEWIFIIIRTGSVHMSEMNSGYYSRIVEKKSY
jgi:hypothetical protein